jgi:hypothetical protein
LNIIQISSLVVSTQSSQICISSQVNKDDELLKVGKLNLVDMAGFVDLGRLGAENQFKKRMKEVLLKVGKLNLVDMAGYADLGRLGVENKMAR